MPRVKDAGKRQKPAEDEADTQQQPMLELGELGTIADDTSCNFFEMLNLIPDANWETPQLRLYIYRIDPPISNRSGDYAYISKLARPIDEDWLKNEHGGGKYQLILKHGNVTLRKSTFTIEGPPKLTEGQTLRGNAASPAPASAPPASRNEMADVVREVIAATGGNQKAADAGIEVMKKAFTDGLELQRTITTSQMGSATGNPMADKLLTVAIENMTKPTGSAGPTLTEQLTLITTIAKLFKPENPAPQQNPQPEPLSNQLSLVKEILGVDSLADLINLRGGGREAPWYVGVIQNAIEKAPVLLQQWAGMQQQAFERALIAAQVRGQLQSGQPIAPVAVAQPSAPPVRTEIVPPGTSAVPSGTGSVPEQMIASIVASITQAYDEGYDGMIAAAHVKLLYPELAELMRPLFADPTQLAGFVAGTPDLAERAREAEWAEFQAEFVQEMMQQPEPPSTIRVVSPGVNGSEVIAQQAS